MNESAQTEAVPINLAARVINRFLSEVRDATVQVVPLGGE